MGAPMIRLILAGQSSQIEFLDIELPQRIRFGGEQLLSLHQMMGGKRILDAMGAADEPICWEGIFTSLSAVYRARYCDTLRRTGEACTLSWGAFSYTGVVRGFSADFTRGGLYIPYRIAFEVAQDNTAFVYTPPQISLHAQMNADMSRANAVTGCIGDSTLSSLTSSMMTSVSAAMGSLDKIARGLANAVSSSAAPLTCAVQAVNNTVDIVTAPLASIASAQAQAQKLIAASEAAVNNVATVGGMLPGNPIAKQLGSYATQFNAAVQLPPLYEYKNLMTRLSGNLTIAGNMAPTSRTVTVGGGSLQKLAAQYYGDATQWQTIAQANNLKDPQISGIQTLQIPPLQA